MTYSAPDYWNDTRRPWVALLFVLPLIVIYEVAIAANGNAAAVRNGADWWMRASLAKIGLLHVFVLPAILIGGLLAWHVRRRDSWAVRLTDFSGMLAESLLFAVLLVLAGHGLNTLLFHAGLLSLSEGHRVISYLGAGIYEEMLFRLALLPLICLLLQRITTERWAAIGGIVFSSLLFAAAHHIGPSGEVFQAGTFVFRSLAGAFFCGLFLIRGFGITVGCHAMYDVLVGIILPLPV